MYAKPLFMSFFKAFCDRCNILFISSTTFYRFKRKLLYPVIWCYWLMHQAQNLAEMMVKKNSFTRNYNYYSYLYRKLELVLFCVAMLGLTVRVSVPSSWLTSFRYWTLLVWILCSVRSFVIRKSTQRRLLLWRWEWRPRCVFSNTYILNKYIFTNIFSKSVSENNFERIDLCNLIF